VPSYHWHIRAQSTVRTFGADKAHWTENIADVTRACKIHIETMVKIQGFLARHAAAVSPDLRQTRYLETLRPDLSSFIALMATWDTVEGDVVDESAFEEMSGLVTDAKERVDDTLLDSEVFVDKRETLSSTEHEVSADLLAGPAGSDVVLKEKETANSTLTGLDGLLETSEALTQELGDAEDRTKPTIHPDDVPELIVSAEESDLRFAESDGHLKEEPVTRGEEGIGNRGPVSDSGLGLSPMMASREAADTPALPKVFFSGFGPGHGAQSDERAHVAAATSRGGRGK
jgi:hypothetical protein